VISLIYISLAISKIKQEVYQVFELIIAPSHPIFACKELSSALRTFSKQIRYQKSVQRKIMLQYAGEL
jgi:adenosine/AMP kinase